MLHTIPHANVRSKPRARKTRKTINQLFTTLYNYCIQKTEKTDRDDCCNIATYVAQLLHGCNQERRFEEQFLQ